MTTVTVQNVPIYVAERGSGPPVVLLHGNPDSAEVWDGVVSHLSANFRCITPDLPGYGRSVPAPDTDYTLPGQGRWLKDFLDAMQLSEPVNIVGHDVGGFYASSFICEHEARVRRLALMDTQFFTDYKWHFWGRVWRTPVLGELSMAMMNSVLFQNQMRRDAPNMPRDYPKQAYKFITPEMKRGVLKLYRLMHPNGFLGWEDRLRAACARVPTLIIWGDKDPYITPEFAEKFGTTNVHHFPDAGHWPMLEKPAEVAELLAKHFG